MHVCLNNFRKNKRNKIKIFPKKCSNITYKKMANYQEVRVKLTNTKLNKLKSAVKSKMENIKIK